MNKSIKIKEKEYKKLKEIQKKEELKTINEVISLLLTSSVNEKETEKKTDDIKRIDKNLDILLNAINAYFNTINLEKHDYIGEINKFISLAHKQQKSEIHRSSINGKR